MKTLPTYGLKPALRKSKPSYAGAANPSGRTQRSYDEARRVGPKGPEQYVNAFGVVTRRMSKMGLNIERIQTHLKTPDDLQRVRMIVDAAVTYGEPGQKIHKSRALIAYFEKEIPTIAHPQVQAYLKSIVIGLKFTGGTNAQQAEAQRWQHGLP